MSGFFAAMLVCILAAGQPSCKIETRIVESAVQCQQFARIVYEAARQKYPKDTAIAIRGMCLPMPQGQKS